MADFLADPLLWSMKAALVVDGIILIAAMVLVAVMWWGTSK